MKVLILWRAEKSWSKLLKLNCQIVNMEHLAELSKKIGERFGNEVERIILFGSCARGDYGGDSDIDLLVIVSDKKIEYELRKIVYSFIPRLGRLISVKVIDSKDYERMRNMNSSFIRSIEKEGVVIG